MKRLCCSHISTMRTSDAIGNSSTDLYTLTTYVERHTSHFDANDSMDNT